jgi:hypothetical protein
VITDGIEYDKDGVTIDEVYDKITTSSVIIHTLGLPTISTSESDKEESKEALKLLGSFARNTLGVHGVLGYDDKTETDIANEITGFVNNLNITRFELSNFETRGGSYFLRIVFATTGENGDLFDTEGTLNIPYPRETSEPAVTLVPAPGGSSDISETSETASTMDGNSKEKNLLRSKIYGIEIWHWIIILVVLILFVISIIILLKKRKKTSAAASDSGIFMKAEVLSENCNLKNNQFYLSDELIIGRDSGCDIRLMNKDISKRNSRLYVRDNIIYIEDLNSTNGTIINNMKIFSPNKLRSGDVISIGSVKFSLKF